MGRRPYSSSTRSTPTTSQPPTQVFTRGRTGIVKTKKSANNNSSRRATSMEPLQHRGRPHSHSASRYHTQKFPHSSAMSHEGRFTHATTAVSSIGSVSFGDNSTTENGSSEDHQSIHSAPTPAAPTRRRSEAMAREGRDPVSSRGATPAKSSSLHQLSSNHSHSTPHSRRDSSPDRSVDMQKQHVRTTKKIVEEMKNAHVPSRRIASVTNACSLFDHHDETRHNIEIAYGAAAVLGKMLQQPVTEDEMRIMCAALEMVFRASPNSVQQAFQRQSASLLPALLRCLVRCEERSVKHADISILNITKILYYLAACPDLRVQLCRQQGLVEALSRVASVVLNPDCRSYRLLVTVHLAAEERNKVLLFETEGLLAGILRIAHMDTCDLARHNAAHVIQELASCDVLHLPLAQNDQLLGTLVKMAVMEKSLPTRESVISALQTLAFTKKNRLRLCTFKEGVVLEALRKSISVDSHEKVRRRAAGTLTNLACEETALCMGNHKGLLETLAIVATKDLHPDVQARSALALTKIASHLKAGMNCFTCLLDALVAASLSKSASSIIAVMRVKAREAENRRSMAHHEGVLDTLVDVCVSKVSTEGDRDNAMRTLMHLLNDEANRPYMCTKNVLKALVRGANYDQEGLSDARESAMIAMERMATVASNRAFMARFPGLLPSVAKAVEREVHLEDARVASEHGYLAKPLLMTLLLAM